MQESKILIVDDNEEVLIALEMYLKKHFMRIETMKNPNMLPSRLKEKVYDLIILDMNFSAGINSGNEGLFWLREILKLDEQAIVILITAYADLELAVKAVKEGATDFISKPWDNKKLLATLLSALRLRESKLKINKLEAKKKHLSVSLNKTYDLIYGNSLKMKCMMTVVDKVAATDANVLVLGENGTGKELIARELHNRSLRNNDIFVSVDVAALSDTLFESEMFGHVKGAFTDAKDDRVGRFELANGGTLFLDEIGNLSLPMQAKMLSAIQNKQIYKVGSSTAINIDVRLICATNKPLYQMVDNGRFREDLLYRINTIQLDVPPLRDRSEDIPVLANHFLKKNIEKYRKTKIGIAKSTMEMLQKNLWPGNVRELEHAIEKAVIMCEGQTLKPENFQFGSQEIAKPTNFKLEDHEKHLIANALRQFKGNLTETAEALGITRATLYRKIEKYGI